MASQCELVKCAQVVRAKRQYIRTASEVVAPTAQSMRKFEIRRTRGRLGSVIICGRSVGAEGFKVLFRRTVAIEMACGFSLVSLVSSRKCECEWFTLLAALGWYSQKRSENGERGEEKKKTNSGEFRGRNRRHESYLYQLTWVRLQLVCLHTSKLLLGNK